MTIRSVVLSFVSGIFLAALTANAEPAQLHGITFDPAPPGSWQCGLTNEDLPGLAAEGMTHPLAAACARGDARAFAVIVDLSDARHAMSAEQMADDAQDQLPSSWKITSKRYDLIAFPGGRTAAHSRLVGKGDGFTFLGGQTSTVAISFNVPITFEDEAGTPRQAIAVFRARAPLPGSGQQKVIEELDQSIESWAASAQPTSRKNVSARNYEIAMQALNGRTATSPASPTPSSNPASQLSGDDRIVAALTAALQQRASGEDLTVLAEAEKHFEPVALGSVVRSIVDENRHAALQARQLKIFSTAVERDSARANELVSRFLIAALERGDPSAVEPAIKLAVSRGWSVHNLSPAAADAVASAILKHELTLPPADRAFLEMPSTDLRTIVLRTQSVPTIEQLAQRSRQDWRLKDRRGRPQAAYLVHDGKSVGILERTEGTESYHYRTVSNLADLAAVTVTEP